MLVMIPVIGKSYTRKMSTKLNPTLYKNNTPVTCSHMLKHLISGNSFLIINIQEIFTPEQVSHVNPKNAT